MLVKLFWCKYDPSEYLIGADLSSVAPFPLGDGLLSPAVD